MEPDCPALSWWWEWSGVKDWGWSAGATGAESRGWVRRPSLQASEGLSFWGLGVQGPVLPSASARMASKGLVLFLFPLWGVP